MTHEKPPNSELDEIEERLGDAWSLTERENAILMRWLLAGVAIIITAVAMCFAYQLLVNGNG